MLMDSKQHSKFTEAKATVSRKIGGAFSAYDGYCSGTNLELVADKKIVQSWRGSDWVHNHFSTITFSLAQVKTGTRLTFIQRNVPDNHYESIKQGWIEHYWSRMKELLNE